MGVPGGAGAENLPVEVRERRKERDGPVPLVIMSARAGMPASQRQPRLGAFEGLALAFFITAEHQRAVRRIEIKANHVPELALKVLVAGKLEGAGDVRLEVVGAPDAL